MDAVIREEDHELRPAPIWANIAAMFTRRMPRGRSRFIEWSFRGSDKRFVGKMDKKLGGYEFDCCLRDMLARDVFFAGCFAAQEIAFVRAVLRRGMKFADVGANWGLFTLVAAHLVGESGQVVALEPDPRILPKLKGNVERNGLKHIKVFDVAAADQDSNLILAAHDHEGENWGISRLVERASPTQCTFTVQSRRLDSLLDEAELDIIDLLKIDVEGAEDRVLCGMEAGLSRNRYRRILLELHPLQLAERGRTVRDVANALTDKGYKSYALDYSQAGIRRAYYHPWLHFTEFIRPLKQGMLDPQPHTIWLCPGEPDLI